MKELLKNKCTYVVIAMLLIMALLGWFSKREADKSRRLVDEVEYIDSLNRYNKIFYDKKISDLKNENKVLYDSVKKFKNDIDFLIQFKHSKTYETGVVTSGPSKVEEPKPQYVKDQDGTIKEEVPEARTYEYESEPNDTFQYKLRINSEKKPNWYSITARVSDKFTIINKKKEGSDINHITIDPNGSGTISDVTVFSKKEKKKLKDRISIGPGATAGYDPFNKRFGVVLGLSVSYDLW